MADVKISQLLNIQRRFLRSAQLERDFHDPAALQGYVVTTQTRQSFGRIVEGLDIKSGQRAWRITGDYGSGKSSFALLLAQLFSGKDSDLPPQIRKCLDLSKVRRAGIRLLPILVTGSREPLAVALSRSLCSALSETFDGRSKSKVLENLREVLDDSSIVISDQAALQFLLDANSELIYKEKAQGLLIILDELGKFLEFAAFHPDRQDIFLLQRLAELSTRSGKEPIFTIGLLHQGFNAYANQLSQPAQREWEKVAGRFDEILFDQPLDQITHLICSALNVSQKLSPRGIETKAIQAMRAATALGSYGAAPATSSLVDAAPGLYPLHPTLIPVLVRLFSRFGQNERSLFSFLLSTEPFGLQAFAQGHAGVKNFYRIHHLYDYASTNFGHRLSVQSYRSHWNHIDSLVRSFPSQNETELAILKTVGLLNLINAPELVPTDELLVLALGALGDDSERQVRSAINRLHKERHVLYSRGRAGGYCLWSHSSVNLEAAYENASRAVSQPHRVADQVMELLEARPIVARRHYIQTGNLRHFDLLYCTLLDLEKTIALPSEKADGRIVIPLCESQEEVQLATEVANSIKCRDTVVGITDPLASLAGLLAEVQRWTWVEKNTLELKDDRYAAEEVARQLSSAKQTLEKRVQHYVSLNQPTVSGSMPIRWYYQGKRKNIRSGIEFISYLSELCDDLFDQAPKIQNELVNRRNLSSAAASARMRVIERMFSSSDKEFLGMDPAKKPPEMSIYLSLLQQAQLHVAFGGGWKLQEPKEENDPCRLRPVLAKFRQILESKTDQRVPVSAIFSELRQAPYGVRDGVLPILLVLILLEHQHEIALYENGTFVSVVAGEEILRLTKVPEIFELQLCRVQGIRRELFDKISELLGVGRGLKRADILAVVRPLCIFVAQLPEYSRNTQRLDLTARAVRDALLSAREPATLLFHGLPAAIGLPPFAPGELSQTGNLRVQEYIAFLRKALDDLKLALPQLKDRIREQITTAFEMPKTGISFQAFRDNLSERARNVVVQVSDMELKAFCLRLLDSSLPEPEWLESVGSLVATTPPSRWKDSDETAFTERLAPLVRKFQRVESLSFQSNRNQQSFATFRVELTTKDGSEKNKVLHLHPGEDRAAADLAHDIAGLLKKHDPRISLEALSRNIWNMLGKNNE
jgi:hypothetical protein